LAAPQSTVLVVDDDESIRLLCRINLELEGYVVVEAATLKAAREALLQHPVDLLLLDVRVGVEDGLAFLDELRGERSAVRVALLTGDTAVLSGASAEAVIPKPFTLEQFRRTVRGLVEPLV